MTRVQCRGSTIFSTDGLGKGGRVGRGPGSESERVVTPFPYCFPCYSIPHLAILPLLPLPLRPLPPCGFHPAFPQLRGLRPFLFTTSFLTTRRAPEQAISRPLLAFASIAPHALAPQAPLVLDPRNTRYGVFTLDLSTAQCACWLSDLLTPSSYSLVSTSAILSTPQQTSGRGLSASTVTAMESGPCFCCLDSDTDGLDAQRTARKMQKHRDAEQKVLNRRHGRGM